MYSNFSPGVIKMNKRFAEEIEIVNIKPLDIQEITANVTINVKGYELKCFVSDLKDRGPFYVGEKNLVILSLMTWPKSLIKIEERKREVKGEQREGTPNHCILSGEIVEFNQIVSSYLDSNKRSYYTIEDTDYKYGIVNCSIFVAVEIEKTSNLKIGDHIKAEGRLDIKKVAE